MTVVELAEKAGISHPYLVRIEGGKRRLSVPIAERLAAALEEDVGTILGLEGNSVAGNTSSTAGLREDAEPYVAHAGEFAPSVGRRGDNMIRWRITSNALDKAGIKAGAIVFVDISAEAVESVQPLDCVIAQVYTGDTFGPAKTIVRQFVPPGLLITNSSERNELPLDLDRGEAYIKGVIRGEFTPRGT